MSRFLQGSLTAGIIGFGSGIDTLASNIINELSAAGNLESAGSTRVFGGMGVITSPIMLMFILILMGYCCD
ncbi:conjugal transfer protein TrbL family protein [Anaerovirgula multivorans]|uniref:conjugal transfer protein TrbL family protein n=1 Tax=Anaerovirgula multivorans TaxID=312168 RepID=UPI0038B9585C